MDRKGVAKLRVRAINVCIWDTIYGMNFESDWSWIKEQGKRRIIMACLLMDTAKRQSCKSKTSITSSSKTFDDIPNHNLKVLIGDFNARLGGDRRGFKTGFCSDKDEWLVSLCKYNGLCVGNTYFQHRRIHKGIWLSPDGRTLNEINFIYISQKWRSSLHHVRVYRIADVGSDHYLVRVQMKLKLINQKQSISKRLFAMDKLKNQTISSTFSSELRNRFSMLDAKDVEGLSTKIKNTTKECTPRHNREAPRTQKGEVDQRPIMETDRREENRKAKKRPGHGCRR